MVPLEELVEEVLLRFPPAEPDKLVRAALVCKEWYAIVSAPRFRRRFCEFHRTPAVVGLLFNSWGEDGGHIPPRPHLAHLHKPRRADELARARRAPWPGPPWMHD